MTREGSRTGTRPLPLAALIAAATLAIASTAAAQGARGTLSGVVLPPAGAALPMVTLTLTNLATGVDRRVVNEPSGEFVFGGLVAGTYRLRADVGDAFAPWAQDQIVVAAGATVTVRVQLSPRVPANAGQARATVSGTVVAADGRPREGVVVIVRGPDGIDRRAVSEPGGGYVLGGLAPGTYRIRAEPEGQAPVPVTELTLAGGETRQVDIRLQPVAGPAGGVVRPARGGATPAPPPGEVTAPDAGFEAKPDRWAFDQPEFRRYMGIEGEQVPFTGGGPFDPYNQNRAKGDFPVVGSTFLNLNLQVNSAINPRRAAVGAPQDQLFNNQNFVAGAELFGGSTVFEPKRWAARATAVINVNGLAADSLSVSDLSRGDTEIGVEELFAEKRLAVTSPSFDFISVRGGMQNFNSDFRGYLFVDNQLGVRVFGNARANRDQFNVAYFSMRERDPVSQLHDFSSRNQDVVIGNYYVQDFGGDGYVFMVNGHLNRDRGPEGDPRLLQVFYAGVHGDGRWGAWSVSHAYYEAFGTDEDNAIARALTNTASAPVDIRARMASLEASRDADWLRYRASVFYSSGDDATDSTVAGGFDAITDNANLAGGQFMYWAQQTTKIDGLPSSELLSEKFSLLPSLRSKFTDRANFVNPGLVLLNGGVDMRLSPELKLVTNVSWLRFADPSVLRGLFGARPGFEDATIGLDVSVGAKFRPFVNENLFVVSGVSLLVPRGGFATALGADRQQLYSVVAALQVAY